MRPRPATLARYLSFGWRAMLGRPGPLIYGLAITDRCNLACRGCEVANTGRPAMTWEQVTGAMTDARRRGFLEVYFSGGEPMLWRDAGRDLEDLVHEARRLGFAHVHVYTNGTVGLDTSADLVWVSMDGLPGTFELRRGDHFARVERAVRAGGYRKAAVIYTIDRFTSPGIEPFLHWVVDTGLPVMGVMFYFHTPYYGYDALFLDAGERAPVLDRLLAAGAAGLPVLNSRAGLRALRSGDWRRRMGVAAVRDVEGEWVCCRAEEAVCEDCGYAAAVEIDQFLRLRPSAVRAMARYW